MKISKYGIVLNKLTHDKIEMVRNWRNDPKISQFMEFRDFITPEMQLEWFRKINNEFNKYFIIEWDSKEIGLINVKDIDFEKMEGEAGIFIYFNDNLKADVTFKSVLCLYDYVFEEVKLNRLRAHIMKDNIVSIYFNKLLGYKIAEKNENAMNQSYVLERENYFKFREKIILSFEN